MNDSIRAMPLRARAAAASQSSPSVSSKADIPIALSDIMRAERIIDIHWDRHLDRFSVVLADYSDGQGTTVGEALEQARAA